MSKIKLFFICILIGLTVGGLFAILFNQKHHVDDKQTVYIGIHTQKETEKKEKRNFKQALGFNPHLVSTSLSWESFFPKSWVEKTIKNKSIPIIRWNPLNKNHTESFSFKSISEGIWDDYLLEWVNEAKHFEYTLLINFSPGINSKNYKWNIFNNPDNAKDYKEAFKYIVQFFKKEGAYNVLWIYECDTIYTINTEWVHPKLAYPGEAYIDWISIRGKNTPTTQEENPWKNVEVLFEDSIDQIDLMAPHTPIMLTGLTPTNSDTQNSHTWYMNIPLFLESSLSRVNAILFNNSSLIPHTILSHYKNYTIFEANIHTLSKIQPYKKKSTAIIVDTPQEKVIDTNLKEWNNNTFTAINKRINIIKGAHYWTGPHDFSAHVSWQASKKALYFAIKLYDDTLILSHSKPGFNIADHIEILIASTIKTKETVDADSLLHLTLKMNKDNILKIWNIKEDKALKKSHVKIRNLKEKNIIEGALLWEDLPFYNDTSLDTIELIMLFSDSDHRLQKYPTKMNYTFKRSNSHISI